MFDIKVDKFIKAWQKHPGAIDMFTNGKCFWFAKILEDAFPGGTIYYDAVIGHFYYQYNDLFWDICGKHLILDGDSNLIEWDELQWEDCLWAKRIKRDCVFFEEVEF